MQHRYTYEVIPDAQPTQPADISVQTITNNHNSNNHSLPNNNNNGVMIVLQESIDKTVHAAPLRVSKTVSFANDTIFKERIEKYAPPPRAPKQVKPKRKSKQTRPPKKRQPQVQMRKAHVTTRPKNLPNKGTTPTHKPAAQKGQQQSYTKRSMGML